MDHYDAQTGAEGPLIHGSSAIRLSRTRSQAYVLLTAAYNEEKYIEETIQSVLQQTLLPQRWVIVSDNSTDRTDEIVQRYAAKHEFMRLLRVTSNSKHNFGAKGTALLCAESALHGIDYGFIGNLDADISLENGYYAGLLSHCAKHADVGITSGFVYEDHGKGFQSRWFNSVRNVPHAAQLVRRACYEAIGGYAVLKYGGEDWYAQTCAKMNGWKVEAIPQLKIYHHRHTGASNHFLRNAIRLGKVDYSFGSDPMFEIVKCMRKFNDKPYFVFGAIRLLGFAWCYLSGEKKAVPDEFAEFLRREQRSRVFSFFKRSPVVGSPGGRSRQIS
jgi:glycosyltransferase involved in cell wall biosynthesis